MGSALVAGIFVAGLSASGTASAATGTCGVQPSGSYTYRPGYLSTAADVYSGPYSGCGVADRLSANAQLHLICHTTNSYGNEWFWVADANLKNGWVYSGDVAAGHASTQAC